MKARRSVRHAGGGPVVGKPFSRSSSIGVRRRNRPLPIATTCLKRDGVEPPSPGEDRARRSIERIGERDPAFGVEVARDRSRRRASRLAPFRYSHCWTALRDEERLRHVTVGPKDLAERVGFPSKFGSTDGVQTLRRHMTPAFRKGETCVAPTELLRDLRRVTLQLETASRTVPSSAIGRLTLSTGDPRATPFSVQPLRGTAPSRLLGFSEPVRHDEHAPATLREPVVGSIHDAPLDQVPEVGRGTRG